MLHGVVEKLYGNILNTLQHLDYISTEYRHPHTCLSSPLQKHQDPIWEKIHLIQIPLVVWLCIGNRQTGTHTHKHARSPL